MASVNVKVDNLFPNLVATKNIDISKLNVTGDNFKKTFGSDKPATIAGLAEGKIILKKLLDQI